MVESAVVRNCAWGNFFTVVQQGAENRGPDIVKVSR